MPYLTLQKLRLRDYRCFESIEIELHSQLTVLVAANGAGKTSILDAIAVALGPYIGAFGEAVGKHFEPSDIRLTKIRQTATNEMEYAPKGVSLEAVGIIPGSLSDSPSDNHAPSIWRRTLTSPTKAKTTIKGAKELIDYGKRMQEAVRTPGSDVLLPLIAYYGTGRLWQQKKLMANKKLERTSRTIGYADCLDPASSYKTFVAWFRYWNLNAKELQLKEQANSAAYVEFSGYITSVKSAVDTCLRPAGWKGLEYSFKRDTLVAHHDQHGELPVELLSDGIRNMIGMVADIAFRATKLNGQLGAQAATQTPGIVLIDEVDMHLHPEWQQIVLQSLTQAFPALQFIVTTHSPQVLTTVPRENIRLIECDESGCRACMPDFSPLAHESGDALAKVMGTHREPPLPLQESIRQFEQLVRAGREASSEAQRLRGELDEAGYQLHESDLTTWRFLAARNADKGS
ncbi:MAG: AAA family ATPase [Gammaproteobacteria bacterium]|nr:AAA family ATPase [Gammaproteobacteria bacterium]